MSIPNFLAIVLVTNGKGEYIGVALREWIQQFELGIDLFVCGPRINFEKHDLPDRSIINFDDNGLSNRFFEINKKKHAAGLHLQHRYVFFLHDRFLPSGNFRSEIVSRLVKDQPDFGGIDVNNLDSSPSLREIRLKKENLGKRVQEALDHKGRFVTSKFSPEASDKIAVNGGAFFLHRDVFSVLNRSMHWSEMEDDIMSLDLQNYVGVWYETPYLVSQASRSSPLAPSKIKHGLYKLKLVLYALICKFISISIRLYLQPVVTASISDYLSMDEIKGMKDRSFFLVDPAHKAYTAEYFHCALEKFMAKLRVATDGKRDFRVKMVYFGWEID